MRGFLHRFHSREIGEKTKKSLFMPSSQSSTSTPSDNCKSTGDVKHATLAVTVTASGRMLPSFLIFKGRPGG